MPEISGQRLRRTGLTHGNIGGSLQLGKIRPGPDCLADEPVACEPVSSANSLLAGKKQGIFANLNQIQANGVWLTR